MRLAAVPGLYRLCRCFYSRSTKHYKVLLTSFGFSSLAVSGVRKVSTGSVVELTTYY